MGSVSRKTHWSWGWLARYLCELLEKCAPAAPRRCAAFKSPRLPLRLPHFPRGSLEMLLASSCFLLVLTLISAAVASSPGSKWGAW